MAGPFIDAGEMLLDPEFSDQFSVVQRIQSITTSGRVSVANTTTAGILGVVTPAKPGELRRVPEMQRGHRTIVIFTQARLNSAAQQLNTNPPTQRQPDYLLWRGDTFIVKEVLPWTSYGPGWVRVIATSIDSVEAVT